MDISSRMGDAIYDEVAVMDDTKGGAAELGVVQDVAGAVEKSPLGKTRSLSDGGGTQLSPSPLIIEASRRTSKDDSVLNTTPNPVTPRRPNFQLRGLSLQMPPRDPNSPAQPSPISKPTPLSPKLDHSQTYASPTNILPRRSRGLDFSRAATSLHHSTLAEQSSPDSSPTIGGRAMNIPGRRPGEYGTEQSTNSLWSMMGSQERMNISNSLGSVNMLGSDSSSSSDDDDLMDDDMEEPFITTPQVAKTTSLVGNSAQGPNIPWMPGQSPAMNSLQSFRTRPRKQPRKKLRGPLGLGFNPAAPPGISKSPPNNVVKEMKEQSSAHSRRESISWAANQLHISGSEEDRVASENGESPQRPGVIRRAVTRRGSLLPKTKGFARIRAALMEENAPVDTEFRREAEVVRQVRESDVVDLEPSRPPTQTTQDTIATTAQSSPQLIQQDSLDEVLDDDLMIDGPASLLSSSFKQQAIKNSKGKNFWDTFSEGSSIRTTPPPPATTARASSSGQSEDINMDSPGFGASLTNTASNTSQHNNNNNNFGLSISTGSGSESQTPLPFPMSAPASQGSGMTIPPTAAEITRRINNKRRRDDDFDPVSFKRRAVSPGMSVHNSPIMQSPLQRDGAPWGSRPGSNHGGNGDKASGTPSENGDGRGSGNGSGSGTAPGSSNGERRSTINGAKGRVGFQGMVDTNDGLMRMSIE